MFIHRVVYPLGLILILAVLSACSQTPVNDTPLTTLDFGSERDDLGYDLAANSTGVYVVGYTTGSLDGPNKGGADAFLRKYTGEVLWAQQFGTRKDDYATKVAVDAAGNSYVVGYTRGALTLGFNLGGSDTYLRKYNSSGVLQWTRQFGTTGSDGSRDVALDASNNVFVLSADSGTGFVIRKFNSSGVLLTTKTVTSTTLTALDPRALAIDSTGAVVVLAQWNGGAATLTNIRIFKYTNTLADVWNVPFQQTANVEQAYDIASFGTDIYVTARINSSTSGLGARYGKLNSAGTVITVKQIEPTATCNCTIPNSITLDSSGNIYITGYTSGAFTGFTNAGFTDIVVFKYSPTHARNWVRQFGQGTFGTTTSDSANAIAVSDAVYVTGYTFGNLLGDTPYGNADAYLAKLHTTTGAVLGIDN